jgi:hypothetical protein
MMDTVVPPWPVAMSTRASSCCAKALTMLVPSPLNNDDLLQWSGNPFTSTSSYVYGGGRNDVWIEKTPSIDFSKTLEQGTDLVFGRTFEGWSGKGGTYFELNQEYAHLAGIHWRPEHSAYCQFDDKGDLEEVASITTRDDKNAALVSFAWPKLEEYLAMSNASLVRMFDFTLLRREDFTSWGDGPEKVIEASPGMHELVGGAAMLSDYLLRQTLE